VGQLCCKHRDAIRAVIEEGGMEPEDVDKEVECVA
jgi:hypothetical protein